MVFKWAKGFYNHFRPGKEIPAIKVQSYTFIYDVSHPFKKDNVKKNIIYKLI